MEKSAKVFTFRGKTAESFYVPWKTSGSGAVRQGEQPAGQAMEGGQGRGKDDFRMGGRTVSRSARKASAVTEGEDAVEGIGVGQDHEEAVDAEGDAAGRRHLREGGEEGFVEGI